MRINHTELQSNKFVYNKRLLDIQARFLIRIIRNAT